MRRWPGDPCETHGVWRRARATLTGMAWHTAGSAVESTSQAPGLIGTVP